MPPSAPPRTAPDTAIVDVDGTLVDTNFHHALAWARAFRRFDREVPLWRLHRAIGMGGDQLVAAVAGEEAEERFGDDVRAAWAEEFAPLLDEIRPFDGVGELLTQLRRRGFRIVLASSGRTDHVDRYLELIDGRALSDGWTTSGDVDRTKPEPDLLEVALDRVGGTAGVVIGDSVWDFRAAARVDAPGYGLRTGGFAVAELREAGARAVYDAPAELCAHLDETALASAAQPA